MNITDEQLNVAICEWMGWTYCKIIYGDFMGRPPNVTDQFVRIPNYLSDDSPRRLLNEAEAGISELLRPAYESNLYKVCGESWSAVIYARARQRTIAILKTVKPEMFL